MAKQNFNDMKKVIFAITLSASVLFSSCASYNSDPCAVGAGAAVGGMAGSLIGGSLGGWGGSIFGSLLGSLSGAAIASAATSRPEPEVRREVVHVAKVNPKDMVEVKIKHPNSIIALKDLRFNDTNKNMTIDSGETCELSFEIINEGNTVAYDVVPTVQIFGTNEIEISDPMMIDFVNPGQSFRYTVTLRATNNLSSGEVKFRIYTVDRDKTKSDTLEFRLSTAK